MKLITKSMLKTVKNSWRLSKTVEDSVKYDKKLIKWTVFAKTCKMTIPGYFVTIWNKILTEWEFSQNKGLGSTYTPYWSLTSAKYQKNLMSQFWAIYKKVDFVQLLRPLLLLLALFRGKWDFSRKITTTS